MSEFAEGREYRVVLKSVPPQAAEAAAAELVLLFPIDRAPAAQIVQAAPIVLLDKLNFPEPASKLNFQELPSILYPKRL